MKRYVFLTNSVRNIGGSQLYMASKIDWLEKKGWMVDVYFYNDGPIIIDKLKKYYNNRIPQLSLPFEVVSMRDKNYIVGKVCPLNYEQTIFESNETHLCVWGEYFSEKTAGMNLCYPLSESFPKLSLAERVFFENKLKNNLLFGITNDSIPMMLGDSPYTQNRGLMAVVSPTKNVSDIECDLVNSIRDGKTIISIGRLDKPYIKPMVRSIIEFARKHSDSLFNVIFIGGAADPTEKDSILAEINYEKNINAFCTGYINPVPRSIIKKGNVAICSAGCVLMTSEQQVLTIVVDAKDLKAIGVYGITTTNTIYRTKEPKQEIVDLLESILFDRLFSPTDIKIDYEDDYSQHEQIISSYVSGKACKTNWPLTMKQKIHKTLYSLLGYKYYVDIISKLSACLSR